MYTEIILPERVHGLGRHVEHDERSRDYAIQTVMAGRPVQIKSVDWSRRAPIFDQGQIGACTGYALVGCIATDSAEREGNANLRGEHGRSVYELATRLDRFPGVFPPIDTGSSGNSAAKAARKLGLIVGYRWAFSLNSALQWLMHGPFITGVLWRSGMNFPQPTGLVSWTGNVEGGHEFCAVGFDAEKQLIKFANSWGPDWGQDGYFYMSVPDFGRALKARGDVTIPIYN